MSPLQGMLYPFKASLGVVVIPAWMSLFPASGLILDAIALIDSVARYAVSIYSSADASALILFLAFWHRNALNKSTVVRGAWS